MPEPRQNAAVASCNGLIYVFGGQTTGSAKFRNTWVYNPAYDAWQTGFADIPGTYKDDGRCGATAISLGDGIWLVGGYGGSTPQESRVDIYHPDGDWWEAGPSLNHPLQDGGVFRYADEIYGMQTIRNPYAYPPKDGGVEICNAFDPSPSWTEISVFYPGRFCSWAMVGTKVYGIGGSDGCTG